MNDGLGGVEVVVMQDVMGVDSVIARIRAGQHPAVVIEDAAGPILPERSDIASREEFLAGYNSIVGEVAASRGEVGKFWASQVADQLVGGDPQKRADMIRMAQDNRDEYTRNGASDNGGDAPLWSAILHGILATPTEQIPPSAPKAQ